MPATVHDILERAHAANQRLTPQEAVVLFSATTRLASTQGATIRARLVQIEDNGALHLLPFDDHQPEHELGYLAPELLSADAPRKNEPRVQVYAAGAFGYELITGRQPSGGPIELTGPLGDILRMALSPDRRERFGDLVQLHDAVEGVQPRLSPEQERQILLGLRNRAARWGAPPMEKEALAKLIGQLAQLERSQRQSLERLDRLEEGLRRADEARRRRPNVVLPAAFAGALAGGVVVGAIWAAGMLGAAARPPVSHEQAQPAAEQPPIVPPAPPKTEAQPPVAPPPHVEHDAGARAEPPDAAAEEPEEAPASAPAPDAAVTESTDAGASQVEPASDAGVATAQKSDDAGVPAAVKPESPAAPARKPPAKRAEPQVTQQAMAHAVALSQVKRGDNALASGRVDEALASYRTALENEPTLPEAFRGLATAYTMQGDDKRALQNYQRYLQLAPKAKDAADVRKAMTELKARGRAGGK